MLKLSNNFAAIAGSFILLAYAAVAAPTVYLNDPFADAGWNTGGGDAQGGFWFSSAAGALSIVDDTGGIGAGNALRLSGSTSLQKLLTQFNPTTLTDPGDWVQLNMDFRFESGPPSSVFAGLMVGFYRTGLTRTTADGTTTNRNDDFGLGGYVSNPGANGYNIGIFSEYAGDDVLGGSPDIIPLPPSGPGLGVSTNCGTSSHRFTLRLTRDSIGYLTILAQIDDLPPAASVVNAASLTSYTFDSVVIGEGNMTVPLLVDNVSVTGSQTDDFDRLRLKWLAARTGGTNYNLSDSQVTSRISSIVSQANSAWNSLNKAAGRTYLWSDITTSRSSITTAAARLENMARGYATYGGSLYQNAFLGADIVSAMDWFYTNYYNETMTPSGVSFFYDEIQMPLELQNAYVMVYDLLTPTQVSNYAKATANFVPTATVGTQGSYTAANLMWRNEVVAIRGILSKNYIDLRNARDSMSKVLAYVTSGDGFYADGSFIQHGRVPYTAGYGNPLLDHTSMLMEIFPNSAAQILDPARTNLFNWVFDSYAPIIYRGAAMDIVRGREISRSSSSDHVIGRQLVDWIFRVSRLAPPGEGLRMQNLIKYWASVDSTENYYNHGDLSYYTEFRRMMTNSAVSVGAEPVFHKQFHGMARMVHARPGWAFAVSASSTNVYPYESINNENVRGWFTGDGMTYLYNGNLTQFTDNFWPTVNPYRLPGITVDTAPRADAQGGNYTRTPYRWVGGASLGGAYGAYGMQLRPIGSTLVAKKSWFAFDNEVVCVGAGITCGGTDPVETIVENRRLSSSGNEGFEVNGLSMPTSLGWSSNLPAVTSCMLSGVGGYYFPASASLTALREARGGAWDDINNSGSTTILSNRYLTLWFNHGVRPTNATYAYVLLPNMTSGAVSQYAARPDVVVLTNSPSIHAVAETNLGIVAANFWDGGNQTVDRITVNQASSVVVRESGNTLQVAVSDPTQTNTGPILVTLARSATAVVGADAGISVLQLSPQLQISVNVNGAYGRTREATFSVVGGNVPPTPKGLTAFPSGADVILTWEASATAANYLVKRSLVSGGPYATVLTSAMNICTNTGLVPGPNYYYVVSAANTNGESANSAEVSVGSVPANGRAAWFRADAGVTNSGGVVSSWSDQSGNGRHATQGTSGSQPTLVASALNGKPAIRFDGVNDYLNFTLPINGLTQMTIVMVSANSANRDPGINQGNYAPIFWDETTSWGWTYLSPFQTNVTMRFGTTQTSNLGKYIRPSIGSSYSLTVGVHSGTVDSLYVDGSLVMSAGGKLEAVNGTVNNAYLGRGAGSTYFPGDLAEVLVYTNALSDTDRITLENYLRANYLPAQLPAVAITNPTNNATFNGSPTINLTATASDDSGISRVDFFANSTFIGTRTNAPYNLWWSNVTTGSYSVIARAVDNVGAASFSAPIVVRIDGPPPGPTQLVALAIATNQIDLSWTDNATNETGFTIERKTGAGGTYAQMAQPGLNATSFSDQSVLPGTTYYYRIYATNNAGVSAASDEAYATTPAVPQLPPILAPIADQNVLAGVIMVVTNQATDPNNPPRNLFFTLAAAPAGATINATSGMVIWRPAISNAATGQRFTVVVHQKTDWETNLWPVADAQVIEGFPAANYGAQTSLMVKRSDTTGLNRESFIRFDLSAISANITAAALRLVPTLTSVPGTHALSLVTNDSWDEMTVTWANKPASTNVLGTWVPQENVPQFVDVTVPLINERVSDGMLSFRLWATNSTADGLVYYGSKEGTLTNAPQLRLSATGGISLNATQSFWVGVTLPASPLLRVSGREADGQLRIAVSGDAGPDYRIETSTNLLDWTALSYSNAPATPFEFLAPVKTNENFRFFRALLGP